MRRLEEGNFLSCIGNQLDITISPMTMDSTNTGKHQKFSRNVRKCRSHLIHKFFSENFIHGPLSQASFLQANGTYKHQDNVIRFQEKPKIRIYPKSLYDFEILWH